MILPAGESIELIDLHFHCLPGIDDGPSDWDEAVALCRAAQGDGATVLVATPHVLRGPWLNDDAGRRDELILKLNTLLGGKPSILAGCEFLFSQDAVELWEQGSGGPLTGLNRTGYLLIEFDGGSPPAQAATIFHEFSLLGVTPVIAHPERSPRLAKDFSLLADLVNRGARVQLTAGAIVGDFGARAAGACRELLRAGLVHLVASDAHSLSSRPPRLSSARERIRRDWGAEVEQGLFELNPAALLEGRPLPWIA